MSASGAQLNVCLTSNLMLRRVKSFKEHPIRKLYDAGARVTVNTDDVLVFGRGVSEEFLALYECGLFTASEQDDICLNALSTRP